jgi:hypothetical protein
MSATIDMRENRSFASEIKFLIGPALAGLIGGWVRSRLAPDPNATEGAGEKYRVTSLYFDTESFDVFHRRGSFGRSKYRIRRYGSGDDVFLERKLRTGGLLTKRRSLVTSNEMDLLSGPEAVSSWDGFWFHRRLLRRRLAPVCQIGYVRTARVAMTNCGPIRLTLDEHLHARRAEGLRFGGSGAPIFSGAVVLELKFRCAMPLVFKDLVEKFSLNPRSFSKYRVAAAALGLAEDPTIDRPGNVPNQVCLSS